MLFFTSTRVVTVTVLTLGLSCQLILYINSFMCFMEKNGSYVNAGLLLAHVQRTV